MRSPQVVVALALSVSSAAALAPSRCLLTRPASVVRTSPPLLMAKKKKKGAPKKTESSASAVPEQPLMAIPPEEPLAAVPSQQAQPSPSAAAFVPPPPLPADDGLPPGWYTAVDPATSATYYVSPSGETSWTPPPPQPPAPTASFVPPPPLPADDFMPIGGGGGQFTPMPSSAEPEALPDLEPLAIADEPKLRLPTFSDYSKGPAKPPPPASGQYQSKLPGINQGRSYADELLEKEKKPFMEELVFGLAWKGIFFLVAVEIFINTPAFQTVKPIILNFLGDGTAYND